MKITPIKTPLIKPGAKDIFSLLNNVLPPLHEREIVVITSKIISLCEGNVILTGLIDKGRLVIEQSDEYLPSTISKYGHHFTITRNTLIPMAGIDESNGDGNYILWPKNAQRSANKIRSYLSENYGLKKIGVVITDSTCQPLRRGTAGISIAHSGFVGLANYIGKPDLFDRPMEVTQANIANGLASAAVLVMGEGAEQTPVCIISDVPFVKFQNRNPSAKELLEINISLEEDLFAPFLQAVPWRKGKRKAR